ncbi:MAG: HAMP domain-containing sensor histidine kinase [Acidimicrobiales bacterium]
MRRRITAAILAVVIGTLVLTVAGSLLLVRRAALSTAESELASEGQAIGSLMSSHPIFTEIDVVASLQNVGAFARLTLVGIGPGSTTAALPRPLTPAIIDIAALQEGRTVAGNVGNVVFVAQPLTLTLRQRATLADGLPVTDQPVLVVTRTVSSPVNGMSYFLLVAGVVLVAGIVVATVLARRISAPLERAVAATRQIAGGNLAATVPLRRHDDPELAELARAINTLSENLTRAQGLEREFLLSVSHELRTPLTSIRGYADAIADGATDDVAGAVGIIGSEARRLERLVQDLLDLARLQARRFSLDPQRVDGAEVMAAVAEGFQPEADAAGVRLVTDSSAGELWVDADPDRLGQIVANLVGNALKFATARVEVGGQRAGGWSALWVIDDGPGISPEELPHIFERYYTSDRSRARKSGTGLGLAVVAELAAAMGGTVNAESPVHEGRGARMVVWLPSAPTAGERPAPSPGPPTSAPPLGPPA